MGSVDGDTDAVSRRVEVIGWLNGILPDLRLPADTSDEDLRKQLGDGAILSSILNLPVFSAFEVDPHQPNDVKRFLLVISELGLPAFSIKDIEQGSMSTVIESLLSLKEYMSSEDGQDDIGKPQSPVRRRWGVTAGGKRAVGIARTEDQSTAISLDEKKKGPSESKSQQRSPMGMGQKFREVFQKRGSGSYSDLPAAKISELMHSNTLDSATTQSLLSVVNGILDESIDRKKGEIPHRVLYLLRRVVQEIEHRICTQAEHIKNQNGVIRSREDKYRSKIKALETLVNGTNEENQMILKRLELVKAEKSKFEEKVKVGEQSIAKLLKEKQNAESVITKLKLEIETMKKTHDQHCKQIETSAREAEANLNSKIVKVESLLAQSQKKVKEDEVAYQLKTERWNKRELTFWNYVNHQQCSVENLRISSQSLKQEIFTCQMQWGEEISNLGLRLRGLIDAAENYHSVLAENQRLFNEVQELKGNIRVYCRVRPFLTGQDGKTTIDYIGENGELLISNPYKQGKDGHRMFKFNKVFGPASSQAEVFSDIQPLIRSVLDGFNVCIFAYGQTGSGKTYTMSGPGTSKEDWGVNYRALNDLFEISLGRQNAFLYEVGVQMVEIYNEQVRDLLSNDIAQKRLGIWSTSQPNGLVVPDASLHQVKSTSDVLDLMEVGQANRAVGSTALNERSSRSHSILTVHVRGVDVKNGSTTRGCLHLIDLAGSERVERSEATGERLKEAQHINKSLSALGDVISSLAQKTIHIPYRNSKLTQVLQSSLGGQAKTLMFVQINPDVDSYAETISTLKFAERVSGVELGAARSNKEGKDIKELLEQVSSLKDTLARKDVEIEQLQLVKDLKAKSYAINNDRSSSNMLRQSTSPVLSSMAISQPGQQLLSERILNHVHRVPSERQSYSDSFQSYSELNGSDSTQASPLDADAGALEADYEDRLSNGSDDDFSMGGETDYSVGSATEFAQFANADRSADMSAERMHKIPPRSRALSSKGGQQPTPSKSKDPPQKIPGPARPISSQTVGPSARPPRRLSKVVARHQF